MEHLCTWKPEIIGSKRKVTTAGNLVIWVDKYSLKVTMPDGNLTEVV